MNAFVAGCAPVPVWWTDRRPLWRRVLDTRRNEQERKRRKPNRHGHANLPQPG